MEAPHLSPRGRGAGLWRAPLPPANGSVVRTERRHHANEPIRAVRRACGGSAVRRPAGSHRRPGQGTPCRLGRRDERRRAGRRHPGHGGHGQGLGRRRAGIDLQLWRQGARPRGGLRQQPAAALLRFRGHRRRRLPDALACSRDEHDRPSGLGAGRMEGHVRQGLPARHASRRRHGLPSDRGHAVRPLGMLRRERHGELPWGGRHRVEGLGLGSRADSCCVWHRPQHGRRNHAEHAGLLDLQTGERPVRLPRNLRRGNGPQRLQGPRRPDHGSQVLHGHVRQERRRVRVAQRTGGAVTSATPLSSPGPAAAGTT